MKYASIIPLAGGMTLGAMKTLGGYPEYIFSWSDFKNNDKQLLNYFDKKNIKYNYHVIDKDILKEKIYGIDIVTGVPPCGGLSMFNSSNNKSCNSRGPNAKQNDWMYKAANYVLEVIKPKVYIFENAPNLYSKIGEPVIEKLNKIAEEFGYSTSIVKTSTHLHGIPQKRSRSFFYFWDSLYAPFVKYYNKKTNDLATYLNENVNDNSDIILYDNLEQDPTLKFLKEDVYWGDISKLRYNMKNGNIKSGIDYIEKYKFEEDYLKWCKKTNNKKGLKFIERVMRKRKDGKSYWNDSFIYYHTYTNAIIAKTLYRILHPVEDRFLNKGEIISLMGHPKDYTELKNINMITQNVPVNTAADWINEARKFVKGELLISTQKFLKQNNIKQKVE